MSMTNLTTGPSSFGTGGAQPTDAQGNADLNMPVRAVNRSDTEVVWTYDRQRYTLPPGVPVYVPYLAMRLWQGDPRAIDLPGGKLHEQFRRQEREHLRALYGVYENEERWAQIPLVECYPIDSDIRFETVLLDPNGDCLSDTAQHASENQMLRDALARMQAQVATLASQVGMADEAEAAIAAAGLDPADLERQATDARTVAPEQSMVGVGPERRAIVKKAAAQGGRVGSTGTASGVVKDS